MRTADIVADGHERANAANSDRIRAEVEAKYADGLKAAGYWARRRLRKRMEREIRQELAKLAQPGALY